jgi:hypothetical protein
METETGNINFRLLSTLNYPDNHSIIYRVRSQSCSCNVELDSGLLDGVVCWRKAC